MTKLSAASLGVILAVLTLPGHAQKLILSSPGNQAHLTEVIELPLSEVRSHLKSVEHISVEHINIEHLTAENAETHQILPTQIYSPPEGHDLLLIAVQLPPTGRLPIDFVAAPSTPPQPALVFGREAPERKDDFAWENQYVTYRVYGPALEATGEITSGIDVWSKRVPNLVIDSFYKHDAEGQRTHNPKLSYHVDDGIGLDSYLVGPSRGCGGTGILSGSKLWVSNNYTHLTMISSGPVRFAFELTYAPWNANGVEVTETKRITLDAGTHLNRITSTFTYSGSADLNPAVGLPIRAGGEYHLAPARSNPLRMEHASKPHRRPHRHRHDHCPTHIARRHHPARRPGADHLLHPFRRKLHLLRRLRLVQSRHAHPGRMGHLPPADTRSAPASASS